MFLCVQYVDRAPIRRTVKVSRDDKQTVFCTLKGHARGGADDFGQARDFGAKSGVRTMEHGGPWEINRSCYAKLRDNNSKIKSVAGHLLVGTVLVWPARYQTRGKAVNRMWAICLRRWEYRERGALWTNVRNGELC